jgi:MFS transporter, DHA1 family, multidrug resistance protein
MRLEEWQRNLATLAVAQVVSMSAFSFVFPFIPLYVQTLGVSGSADAAQWAGLISAAAAV